MAHGAPVYRVLLACADITRRQQLHALLTPAFTVSLTDTLAGPARQQAYEACLVDGALLQDNGPISADAVYSLVLTDRLDSAAKRRLSGSGADNVMLWRYLDAGFADWLTTQIQLKHRRRESRQRRLGYLEKLSTFAHMIASRLDLPHVIDQTISIVKEALQVEKVSLLLFEDEALIVKACVGLPAAVKQGQKLLAKDTIAHYVAKNKQGVFVNDIANDPRFRFLRSGTDYKRTSFISAPIMYYQNVLGVINATDRKGEDFRQEDLEFLSSFASHLGVSIVNAHLFLELKDKATALLKLNREKDELNRQIQQFNAILQKEVDKERSKLSKAYQDLAKRDAQLQKKILELMALKKAGIMTLSELFHIELVLDVILNIALRELDAQRGSIILENRQGQLVIKAVAGEQKNLLNTLVEDRASITAYVMKTGKPLLIKDIEAHPLFKRINVTEKYNTKSLLSLPLKVGGNMYGVMNINNKNNNQPFNESDQDLLYNFANHASLAIHNFYLSQALQEKEDIIRQAEKMSEIGSLVVGIAHELRNPMGILRTNIEFLREMDENNQDIYNSMVSQIDRSRRFLKELLQYGKPAKVSFVSSDVNNIIELSCKHALMAYGRPAIPIHKDLPKGGAYVHCDPMKLQQVFINIISNAIDALEHHSQGRIDIHAAYRQDTVRVTITDNGPGVDATYAKDIFKPFFSRKKGDKGTGLGLPIARRIIELHNGRVYLDRQAARGATFVVELPARPPAADASA